MQMDSQIRSGIQQGQILVLIDPINKWDEDIGVDPERMRQYQTSLGFIYWPAKDKPTCAASQPHLAGRSWLDSRGQVSRKDSPTEGAAVILQNH